MADTKKTTEQVADPWNEYEEIFIPKKNRDDNYQYVEVNGRSVQIEKGKLLKVRKPFAEAIKNSQALAEEAEAFIEANRQ